ncbi:hypothetical protein ACTMU2_30420 [Cupriavidus basilensis]
MSVVPPAANGTDQPNRLGWVALRLCAGVEQAKGRDAGDCACFENCFQGVPPFFIH